MSVIYNPNDLFNILIKFQNKDILEKMQKGSFYMKNLKYYNDLEKEYGKKGVGDLYDGKVVLKDVKITAFDADTHEFQFNLNSPQCVFALGYEYCPVFCMFRFDYRNCVSEKLHEDILRLKYKFSDEQKKKLRIFGDSALFITNGNEFLKRVQEAFFKEGISFSRNTVEYYHGQEIRHMRDVAENGSERIAYWKDAEYFEYQQEYRFLAFDTKVEDYKEIDIGNIKDISKIYPIEKMLDFDIEIECGINSGDWNAIKRG